MELVVRVLLPGHTVHWCCSSGPQEEGRRREEEEEEKEERRIGARGGVKQTAAQTSLSARHVKQTAAQT